MEITILCEKLGDLYEMYVNEDIIPLREIYKVAIKELFLIIAKDLVREGFIEDSVKER